MSISMDGMEKEAGLRRQGILVKSSANPNESFRIKRPFRFVQNWMEGTRPLYT